MVARGRGKKATAAAAVAVAVPENEAVVSNGDAREPETASVDNEVAIAPVKKGRQRGGGKKEVKEEIDETPPPPAEVAPEKPAKPTKAAAKGSKKTPKGKAAAAAVEEIPVEPTKEEVLSENDSIEAKSAVVEKKATARKRKADAVEKVGEVESGKKAPKVTKTKGAKKETVDSDGIPEDPSAAGGVSIAVVPAVQTNGSKKPSGRKRGAPKTEEAKLVSSEEPDEEQDLAPAPAKKSSKSKTSKKDSKEPKPQKEIKQKSASKTKSSKKAQKLANDAPEDDEEEATEHDVLPEDEFVPEIEDEEEEEVQEQQIVEEKEVPKPKKVVKSKGSRKQVPPIAVELEKVPEPATDVQPEDQPESEPDSTSGVVEPTTKSKGRKPAASKKEKALAKPSSKKVPKAKKGAAAKDEASPEHQPTPDDEVKDKNNKKNEKTQDAAAADVETSKRKMNGTAKSAVEAAAEPKAGRGRKRAAAPPPVDETDETEKKPGRGKKRAAAETIAPADNNENDNTDGAKITKSDDGLFNPTKTEYNSSDFTLDKEFNMKISSWNIAGLRAWLKKDGLTYLEHEQPDIFCLQEIKCTPDQLPEEARIPGYHPYWLCMPGGHAGVAVYSKIMPINVEYGIGNAEHDESGRLITAEYEKFYLLCVYVPNSGRKLVNLEKRMQWEELFREYTQKLEKVKPVIIVGDMNCSHKEIDLANPKSNTKSAGFTVEERDAMTKLLALGYVDTFRHFHPDQKGAYTYWTYMSKARSRNVGWRLDYFIVSERILSKAVESLIRPQVLGSDHCPITLFLNI